MINFAEEPLTPRARRLRKGNPSLSALLTSPPQGGRLVTCGYLLQSADIESADNTANRFLGQCIVSANSQANISASPYQAEDRMPATFEDM